jgi:hypothetical protein
MTVNLLAKSPQHLVAKVEGVFSARGMVEALTPAMEKARELFNNTPLAGLGDHTKSLPENWSGFRPEIVGLAPQVRARYYEAGKDFALAIEASLAVGIIEIEPRQVLAGYKIQFPVYVASGSGEAAAVLVAAALEAKGIETKVRGRILMFNPDSASKESLRVFSGSIVDLERERIAFFSKAA